MLRNRRAKRYRARLAKRAAAVLLILAIPLWGVSALDGRLRPFVTILAQTQIQTAAMEIVNDAVVDALSRSDVDYNNLVSVQYNELGEVRSLQTKITELNILKAQICNDTERRMNDADICTVAIPIGTLTNIDMLSGRGCDIVIKFKLSGVVHADINNKFSSAGINQTQHRILLNMSVPLEAVVYGRRISAELDTDFVLAETVIVGASPDAFTYLEDGNSSDEALIYRAEQSVQNNT